jgi:DNA-binding transcriptional ArsR family regulator
VETKREQHYGTRARRFDDGGVCGVEFVNEQNVADVLSAMPDEEVLQRSAAEFSLLADPTRLRILYALSIHELCVCDLSRVLNRSMPATSQQLQRLRREGVVKYRMAGKLAYYRLESATLRRLVRDAFRRHGETT